MSWCKCKSSKRGYSALQSTCVQPWVSFRGEVILWSMGCLWVSQAFQVESRTIHCFLSDEVLPCTCTPGCLSDLLPAGTRCQCGVLVRILHLESRVALRSSR